MWLSMWPSRPCSPVLGLRAVDRPRLGGMGVHLLRVALRHRLGLPSDAASRRSGPKQSLCVNSRANGRLRTELGPVSVSSCDDYGNYSADKRVSRSKEHQGERSVPGHSPKSRPTSVALPGLIASKAVPEDVKHKT